MTEHFMGMAHNWQNSGTKTELTSLCSVCQTWVREGGHFHVTDTSGTTEHSALGRIASALERIAAALERKP